MSILGMSIFDLVGTVISIFSVYCMLRKSMLYWYSGIICNILWFNLFVSKSLYISAALQLSYIMFAVYGILRWSHFKRKKPVPVFLDIIGVVLSIVILSIAIWNTSFSSIYNIIETLAVFFLIIANLLTAKERRSCWYFWIIGDILFAVFLGHAKIYGLFGIQFVFLGLSLYGLFKWKKNEAQISSSK